MEQISIIWYQVTRFVVQRGLRKFGSSHVRVTKYVRTRTLPLTVLILKCIMPGTCGNLFFPR